jgi:hypothetical protein
MPKANYAAIEPRGFSRATRLEVNTTELPLGDARTIVVEEIQAMVEEVNDLLALRDAIKIRVPRRPKGLREAEFERLATLYAEKMMTLDAKYKELVKLEKSLNLYDPSASK